MGLDQDVLLAVVGARNPLLDPVMVGLGVIGLSAFTFLWAVPLWFLRRRRETVDLVVLLAVTEVLVLVLKWGLAVERPGPSLVTALAVPFDDVSDPAFPSGHATRAFAAAMLLSLRVRTWRWTAPLVVYAVLVAVSRVYVGVHWPSDVIGGALLGIGATVLVDRVMRFPAYASRRDGFVSWLESLRRRTR